MSPTAIDAQLAVATAILSKTHYACSLLAVKVCAHVHSDGVGANGGIDVKNVRSMLQRVRAKNCGAR